jgi:N-acetylglucosamine-6-phosphate deacetylase
VLVTNVDRSPKAESRFHIAVKRIAAEMLATPSGLLADPIVTLEGAHILEITTRCAREIADPDYDFPGATITAGFFDIHFHGIAEQDVMNASPHGFQEIAQHLARAGVSSFLPATVTASLDTTLSSLERMADYINHKSPVFLIPLLLRSECHETKKCLRQPGAMTP